QSAAGAGRAVKLLMRVSRSTRFEILRRLFASVADRFVFDHLILVKRSQAGALDRGDMDEYVAILRRNESIAFRRVEPFHGASRHHGLLVCTNLIAAAPPSCDPPIRSQRCLRERRTGSCATNKAKLEYRDCTRFSPGVQQRDVIENKSPNPLDNRADTAHRHTIIGHNMNNTGAGG